MDHTDSASSALTEFFDPGDDKEADILSGQAAQGDPPMPLDAETKADSNLEEDLAIAHLARMGAYFTTTNRKIVSLSFWDMGIADTDAKHFASLKDLQELNLTDCHVGDGIWQFIRDLPNLTELVLWGTDITDDGLKNVGALTKLRVLDVRCTSIGDAGLAHVSKLTELEALQLPCTRVTSDGMVHLRGLKKLRDLDLIQTRVGDKGLQSIGELTSLERLALEGTAITDAGLQSLASLNQLTVLTIHNNTGVTENGLRHLEGLQRLENLYANPDISEIGVRALRKMKSLQYLHIGEIDPDHHQWLESQLPGVGVY